MTVFVNMKKMKLKKNSTISTTKIFQILKIFLLDTSNNSSE
ncbi:MAG: hypothetical protein KatS3mg034_0209 [Vicingaceae bacterium]|nr:MAG: hypothetical protein KatS3mg034_0209 [Vicingaceae bacterium]